MRTLPFYVIGHKNPDTDAICSAIGHAEFLRETREPNALAARCGELTQRTRWVLERAGVGIPELVTDVRTTTGMICRKNFTYANLNDSFLVAYERMVLNDVRCVPVMDDEGRVQGMLRYLDLLELLLPVDSGAGSVRTVRTVEASLQKVADTLRAESLGADLPDSEVEEELILLVGASSPDSVKQRLEEATEKGTVGHFLVICGDRPIVQRYAIDYGVRALLVTGGNRLEDGLAELAKKKNLVVLRCDLDTASCSTLIRCSRTVRNVMDRNFQPLTGSECVTHLRKQLASVDQDLFPLNDPITGKTFGVISKSDFVDPPRIRLALVDHNEYAQAVHGVEEADVIEVIDHHRLAGNLISRDPIRYLNEPVGSTSTLVARKFRQEGLQPSAGTAICLSAGIISDTLCLTGPTTTDLDREILSWLCEIGGIDAQEFTKEFFAVGSLLTTGTAEEILNADRKEFSDQNRKVSISQVEELGLQGFAARREEAEGALVRLVKEHSYDLAVLAVTDVIHHRSLILAIGDDEIVKHLPFHREDRVLFDAPGVVSRKKQIFPAVSEALRQAVK